MSADYEPFLTRSQAMRLETRNALPAIDRLLRALEHAATLPALPEQHRGTLLSAARGIRGVCRPVVPEILPGERCPTCPPAATLLAQMDLPHNGDTHQTYHYLINAGYTDCAQIAATPTSTLARVERIGQRRAAAIRTAVPYEGGEDR